VLVEEVGRQQGDTVGDVVDAGQAVVAGPADDAEDLESPAGARPGRAVLAMFY
jgi:hypothetical protein